MEFRSKADIESYVLSRMGTAVQAAQERIYQIVDKFLKQYYSEYSPKVYERTYQLYHSLVKTEVTSTGKGYTAAVYFDASQLDYQTKYLTKHPVEGGFMNPYNHKISPSGAFANPKGSGEKTLAAAAHGSHGGWTDGTAIFDLPLLELRSDLNEILKQELISAGIPVK